MPLIIRNGSILQVDGEIAANENCCCCSDVYAASLFRIRVNVGAGTSEIIVNDTDFIPSGFHATNTINTGLGFDFLNKRLYMIVQDATNHKTAVASVDENLGDGNVIVQQDWDDTGKRYFGVVAVRPADEYVFYGEFDSNLTGSCYLKRIDYDGSNETTLLTAGGSGVAIVNGVAVPKNDDYVFYVLLKTSGTDEVRRCAFDGSGDTSIWTSSDNNKTNGIIFIDNQNERVIFARNNGDADSQLYSCNYDGSDLQTLSNTVGPYIPMGWSHNLEKIIFYSTSSNGSEKGMWGIDADGSNAARFLDHNDWVGPTAANMQRLGCGFDPTGAGYLT